MNDTNTLINKVQTMINRVDRANQTLDKQIDRANLTQRQQELRKIMQSKPQTRAQQVDIVDALRELANDINPPVLR